MKLLTIILLSGFCLTSTAYADAPDLASVGIPNTAGAFLAFCKAKENTNACAAEIEMDYGEAKLNGKGGCTVPADMGPREMMDQTLQWLRTHPQLAGERTQSAIIAAMAELWPCR